MSEASDSEGLEAEVEEEQEVVSEAAEETDAEVTVESEATVEVEEATTNISEAATDVSEATADVSEAAADESEATADVSQATVDISEATAEESDKQTEECEEVDEVVEEEEDENDEPVESLVVPVAEVMEQQYVDVRKLPLRPPQPQLPPEKPTRRPWHPVMWDSSIIGVPPPVPVDDESASHGAEYPHKQRIRNLKNAIRAGKVKPTSETLIFFLCNKFAVSEERKNKVHC